jgi:hypothetical protein
VLPNLLALLIPAFNLSMSALADSAIGGRQYGAKFLSRHSGDVRTGMPEKIGGSTWFAGGPVACHGIAPSGTCGPVTRAQPLASYQRGSMTRDRP